MYTTSGMQEVDAYICMWWCVLAMFATHTDRENVTTVE